VFVHAIVHYLQGLNTTIMSDCTFNMPFTGSADALVATLKTQVQNNSGTFTGDINSGSFSVPVLGSNVAGTYTITGQQIAIDINKRPFFTSCDAIDKFISSHIS